MGHGKAGGVEGVGGASGGSQANWVPEDQWNKKLDEATKGMNPEEKKGFVEELKKMLEGAAGKSGANKGGEGGQDPLKELTDAIEKLKQGQGAASTGGDQGGTTGAAAPVAETQTGA
jgi:hypothetical protein